MSEEERNAKLEEAASLLQSSLKAFRDAKPGDRSEIDRRFAIVITDLEKLACYAKQYIIEG